MEPNKNMIHVWTHWAHWEPESWDTFIPVYAFRKGGCAKKQRNTPAAGPKVLFFTGTQQIPNQHDTLNNIILWKFYTTRCGHCFYGKNQRGFNINKMPPAESYLTFYLRDSAGFFK